MMERRDYPIGVFDSGMGGISVLKAVTALLPGEDFIFFGDSKNAPYGTRSVEEVRRLTLAGTQYLYQKGIKALVIACNTATSAAIGLLREHFSGMPVIGIEPAVKPAAALGGHPRVLVMATPRTVEGEKFKQLVSRFQDQAEFIPLGCPGLVEFVEAGKTEGPEVEAYLEELLGPVCKEGRPDAVVLGCTHYPFLKKSLSRVLGRDVRLLDGSDGTARELRRRLKEENLLKDKAGGGTVSLEISDVSRLETARRLYELK